MSYTSFAVYMQRRVTGGVPPGGDCDPYTRPNPGAIVTNLDTAPTYPTPTSVITDLCEEVT